jgi:hypothetical protein
VQFAVTKKVDLAVTGAMAGLQLAAIRPGRRTDGDFLPQRLAAFPACKLAFPFAVEARFISIEC